MWEEEDNETQVRENYETSRWMYEPLPLDLPTMNTHLLAKMAAYDGNVDRYARLQSPYGIDAEEFLCILRGVYHHTMFARWWSSRLDSPSVTLRVTGYTQKEARSRLRAAIHARRIMINDVAGFSAATTDLPTVIWWPTRPSEATLRTLLAVCPRMTLSVAAAAIICDYEALYRSMQPPPSPQLKTAAEDSANPFFLADLTARAVAAGITLETTTLVEYMAGEHGLYAAYPETDGGEIVSRVSGWVMDPTVSEAYKVQGPYGDRIVRAGPVERYVWLSYETVRKLEVLLEGIGTAEDVAWLEGEELPEKDDGV